MRSHAKPRDELAGMLAAGDRAVLTTAISERLPVRIAKREIEVMLLFPMIGAAGALEAAGSARTLLEGSGAHGMVRVRGDAELEYDGLVRFRVLDLLDVLQRRRFFRVRTPQRVEVSSRVGPRSACSVDISGGGMLMNGPETLERGEEIGFRLYLAADKTPIAGQAHVVRATDEGQRAVEFDPIPRHDEERLIRFLFDRQRAERATIRGDAHGAGGT